jgi:hypothetical protein
MNDKLKVFISYRRDDSSGFSGRIADKLRSNFDVFHDIEGIALGENFPKVLKEKIKKSDVVLFLIGKESAKLFEERSGEKDYLVEEIYLAEISHSRIIPILLDGAIMPNNFPEKISFISQLNAYDMRHIHFKQDIEHLIREIDKSPFKSITKRIYIFVKKILAVMFLLFLAFVLFTWYQNKSVDKPIVKVDNNTTSTEKEKKNSLAKNQENIEKLELEDKKSIVKESVSQLKIKSDVIEKSEMYKGKKLYMPMKMVPLKQMKIIIIQSR